MGFIVLVDSDDQLTKKIKENNMDLNTDLFEEILSEIIKKQKEELALIEKTKKLIKHYKHTYKVHEDGNEIKITLHYPHQINTELMANTGTDYIEIYLNDLLLLIKRNLEELNKRGFNIDFEEQGEQE